MRKQTDLAKVKQTALALLSTEINETPYSPMIVKHPFTDTGVSAIPDGKGGVEMIDLTEDDAQLRWRQSMARQIDKADSAYAIYMMVTKPYALTFLKFAMPHLSREDMSSYIHFTEEQKEQARQTDLCDLLRRQGEKLKRSGREYEWRDGSQKVTIRGNLWFHQYERVGGDAIDFVRKYMNKSYPEAMEYLLGGSGMGTLTTAPPVVREQKPFELPPKNDNNRRAYAYLLNKRGINREVLNVFFYTGLIYESADYHNAVFVGKNPEGVAVHAHKRGTGSESTFKGNVDSSDPRYSFHWIGRSNRVYLFEAPIDMLSFISLHRNGWQKHSYAAACGVSDQVMWQILADHPQIDTVYLCHDSDVDGQKAAVRIANKLTEQGVNTEILVPIRKDWNEDLLYPPDETEEEICIQTM